MRPAEPPAGMDPLGRAVVAAFAELVRDSGRGPVADLSSRTVGPAREACPDLRFDGGSMTALDVADGGLGGILALFSTCHTPPEHLPVVFGGFHRALVPGGHLLPGTHFGDDERSRPTRDHGGHPVSGESCPLPLDRIAGCRPTPASS